MAAFFFSPLFLRKTHGTSSLWGTVTVHGMMELALGCSNSWRAEQQALSPENI